MPDTDLAAELATIREMASQITGDGHTVAECTADLGARCTGHDAERLADAIGAVAQRHSEWRIYDECDHPHPDGDYGCRACYLYSVCRECCASGGAGHTEACASEHDLSRCWPCPTRLDILGALFPDKEGGSR